MFRIAAALLVGSMFINSGLARADGEKKPAVIDAAIIAAYKKLGGDYGTFYFDKRIGSVEFTSGKTPTDPDDLPGFHFAVLPRENLPDAGVPFVIDWSACGSKNADFLKLVDLKNLACFQFDTRNITQVGMSVFENFKKLKWLVTGNDFMYADTIKQFRGLTILSHTVRLKEELSEIATLPELRWLGLSGDPIDDQGLEPLGKLRSLSELHLSDCPITGVGLKGFPSLNRLDFDCPTIDDDGLKTIGALTGLTSFHLRSKAVTDRGLGELKHLVALTDLDLSHSALTDAGTGVFRHLARLEVLDLSLTQITEKGLADLKACKGLRTLKICGVKADDGGIANLLQLPNLKSLDVRATGLSDAKLADLRSHKKLNELVLDEKQFTVKLLKEFQTAGKLYMLHQFKRGDSERASGDDGITEVQLDGTTDAAIEAVKDLKNLEVLRLFCRGVTDAGMDHLKGLLNLRELLLYESSVTKVGLGKIAHLNKLATLDLTRSPVADDAIAILKTMRSLKDLNLRDTKVTDARLAELVELEHLQTLHIEGKTQVTDRLLQAFREKGKRHVLSCFKFYSDPPPPTEADITFADLGSAAISDRGLLELEGLKNLTGINLRSTSVTDAGVAKLKIFKNLRSLELESTGITGACLKEFPHPLKFKSLGLARTKLTAKGLLEVHRFENLTSLDLGDLRFNNDTYEQLQKDFPFCWISW